MKLGDVLRKERQSKGLNVQEMATGLGLSVADLETLEGGKDADFERVGALLVRFNELIEGQVSQLFYPCGIPYSELQGYDLAR